MTKIEELEQKLNECQKALAELKESKKEGKWFPKKKERYWFRNIAGTIGSYEYTGDTTDEHVCKNSPIFKTMEECERYWHFMDTIKEKSYEFSKEEWEDKFIIKWRIEYLFHIKKFKAENTYSIYSAGTIYFKNKSDAQYIIDNFKDELMEYWI